MERPESAAYEIEPADPSTDEVQRCIAHYFADLSVRFEEQVKPEEYPNPPSAELVPPLGVFLIIRCGDVPVGCGALTTIAPAVGYLSRMWVAETVRGNGLGRRLLAALERWAARLGHERIRLYTHRRLTEAQALYRKSGYREVPAFLADAPFADIWFEKRLTVRHWPDRR